MGIDKRGVRRITDLEAFNYFVELSDSLARKSATGEPIREMSDAIEQFYGTLCKIKKLESILEYYSINSIEELDNLLNFYYKGVLKE